MSRTSPHCAFIRAVRAAAVVAEPHDVTRLTVWFGAGEIAAREEAGREDGQIVIDADAKTAA